VTCHMHMEEWEWTKALHSRLRQSIVGGNNEKDFKALINC